MYEQTPTDFPQGGIVEIGEESIGWKEEFSKGERSATVEAPQRKGGLTILLYVLVDPRDGSVRYVGKTNYTLKIRLGQHRNNPRNNHLACWVRSLKELGLIPEIEEVDRVEDSDDKDWQRVERFWISFYRNMGCDLVNLDSGGTGGNTRSEETRRKIGEGNKGKVRSQETLEKLRISHLGKPLSPEHVANMSKAVKGKPRGKYHPERVEKTAAKLRGRKKPPRTVEHQAKLTASHIGRKRSEETRAKMRGPRGPNKRTKMKLGLIPPSQPPADPQP